MQRIALFVAKQDKIVIIKSKQQLWQSIHQACSNIPKKTDLTQELIQERRKVAKKENT